MRNASKDAATWIETRTIEMPGPVDTVVERPLDLNEMLPADRRDVFSISLSPSSDYQDTKIVLWTDVGVLAHWQKDALLVFTHNLFTLEPLAGAKVSLYSHKNQLLGVTTTNALGIAGLDALDASLGDPKLLVVETESDYTFLQLEPREEDHKPFDDTMPAFDRSGYDAFLYADRGIYRPGETVHARWLVRTNYGDAVPAVPFQARLLNSKGTSVDT